MADIQTAAPDALATELEIVRPKVPWVLFDVQYREPQKPRDGMVLFADGTIWNPSGGGGGLHQRVGGAWVKV